jgi:hypothetical protein
MQLYDVIFFKIKDKSPKTLVRKTSVRKLLSENFCPKTSVRKFLFGNVCPKTFVRKLLSETEIHEDVTWSSRLPFSFAIMSCSFMTSDVANC